MNTQLTVRLPSELYQVLGKEARNIGLNRSDIVRMAIHQYLNSFKHKLDDYPYSKISDLVGITNSGISDLGERHREHLLTRMKKDA
ncbi:hypothetical protein COX18_01835 [Candidatus Desantisbacteria bacterium CG23_combo_of_CG06-09_8_20_14_all_40_23]|uniref:Ribbon-helix-helix protein CopG domain-containing protein n=1 Tax=Candidatus Desantisbacteria bacterium CG23_combo_of_CG06-09_8_20_14_all_40_23 TaxID=1974550 RepID=A0A2H0A994_9BACT|nr:MAG: hypothetical protein COX18_01835 [Candidatus Desantisbacteria bacterium CG23_combo_of_CG06-09_8_20_14_all_40_23]